MPRSVRLKTGYPAASAGFRSIPDQPRHVLRRKCVREQANDIPRLFAAWACRAHIRPATPIPAEEKPVKKKREWWRLDPNTADKYKPVEPPAVADPSIRPTRDRIVFPWEAPMSDMEWAVQNYLQKEHYEIYMELIQVALEHGGLVDKKPDPPA